MSVQTIIIVFAAITVIGTVGGAIYAVRKELEKEKQQNQK